MIDLLRKQQLDNCFFQSNPFPSDLSNEEREYISTLSAQWNHALLCLYEKIIQRDETISNIDEQPCVLRCLTICEECSQGLRKFFTNTQTRPARWQNGFAQLAAIRFELLFPCVNLSVDYFHYTGKEVHFNAFTLYLQPTFQI